MFPAASRRVCDCFHALQDQLGGIVVVVDADGVAALLVPSIKTVSKQREEIWTPLKKFADFCMAQVNTDVNLITELQADARIP